VLGAAGDTVAGFVPRVGTEQTLSAAGAVSVTQYHTKLTSAAAYTATLGDGLQDGQLKKITFITDGGTVTLTAPKLLGPLTQIVFNEPGQQVELVWSKNSWIPLCTINTVDVATAAPAIS
jgi:hypothetical protein